MLKTSKATFKITKSLSETLFKRTICIPTPERGNETVSVSVSVKKHMRYHAGAGERDKMTDDKTIAESNNFMIS
jgi:hypothetical protein